MAGHGLDLWADVSTGDVYIDQRGDHANYDMRFRTRTTGTPVDAMTITGGGNVSIGDGDLVIGTSGHGIDFSATSDGSGTSINELLDDYEEGTFTPRLGAHLADGTHSYTQQQGKYTKVGNKVSLWIRLAIDTLNTSGTINGNIQIEDLPFTSANVTGQVYVGTFLPVGLDMDSGTGPVVTMGINSDTLSMSAAIDNASYDQFTSADVASGDEFWIQINYPV